MRYILVLIFLVYTYVQNIDPFDELGKMKIEDWQQKRQAIILLGTTGVGKSTLINFLTGYKLKVKESKITGQLIYVLDQHEDNNRASKIGEDISSQTSLPVFVHSLQDRQVSFFDTAGFTQTRGYVNQIVNYYGIHKMLNWSDKLKLIIVIDELGLQTNKLNEILKQLKLNSQFSNSVGLVITKVKLDNYSIHQLLLKSIINTINEGIEGAELLKNVCVLKNYEIFRIPQMSQKPLKLKQQRNRIFRMINQLDFASSKQVKKLIRFQQSYIIEKKRQTLKNKLLKKNKIRNMIKEKLMPLYSNYQDFFTKKLYYNYQQPNSISKMLELFENHKWKGIFLTRYKQYRSFLKFLDNNQQQLVRVLDKIFYQYYKSMSSRQKQQFQNQRQQQKNTNQQQKNKRYQQKNKKQKPQQKIRQKQKSRQNKSKQKQNKEQQSNKFNQFYSYFVKQSQGIYQSVKQTGKYFYDWAFNYNKTEQN